MKRICLLVGLLTTMPCAMSAEIGFGVGVGSSNRTIYVPVNVAPGLRIEPYVSFSKTANTSSGTRNDNSASSSAYGVGLFATRTASENTNLHAGLRIAYLSDKYDSTTHSDSYSSSSSSHSSGYLLAPTIGFEFLVQKNISLGAEAAIAFSRSSGNDTYTYADASATTDTKADSKMRTRTTSTAVTLKYYFD